MILPFWLFGLPLLLGSGSWRWRSAPQKSLAQYIVRNGFLVYRRHSSAAPCSSARVLRLNKQTCLFQWRLRTNQPISIGLSPVIQLHRHSRAHNSHCSIAALTIRHAVATTKRGLVRQQSPHPSPQAASPLRPPRRPRPPQRPPCTRAPRTGERAAGRTSPPSSPLPSSQRSKRRVEAVLTDGVAASRRAST